MSSSNTNKSWNKKDTIRILVAQQNAIKLRIKENQKISCELCENKGRVSQVADSYNSNISFRKS